MSTGRISPSPEAGGSRTRPYSLWQSHYQGRANILGTAILLDRKPYVIIGVMPRNFEFPLTLLFIKWMNVRYRLGKNWLPRRVRTSQAAEKLGTG